MKIALGLEYCGINYCGWQRQRHGCTVQERVEDALSIIAAHPVQTVCAGRTDSGVHATKQVIHFETAADREPHAWVLGANINLPADIAVLWAQEVGHDFHARFSALSRTYHYYILNRPSKPGLDVGRVTWERRVLDVGRMQAAAAYLAGEHNFNSFRASGCQAKNPVRVIYSLDLSRLDNDIILLVIKANAFVQHMVRNIAGTLMMIGCGKREPEWVNEILLAQDRAAAGVTAQPDGLYLYDITYPDRYRFPAPAAYALRFNSSL